MIKQHREEVLSKKQWADPLAHADRALMRDTRRAQKGVRQNVQQSILAFPCLGVFAFPVGKRHSENTARHSEVHLKFQNIGGRAKRVRIYKASFKYKQIQGQLEQHQIQSQTKFNSREHSFV